GGRSLQRGAPVGPISAESAIPLDWGRPDGTLRSAVDERVLLVEDDASIREVAALGLKGAGFRVTTSGDGREGLMRARRDPFDVVVLDVMLPSLDGFE